MKKKEKMRKNDTHIIIRVSTDLKRKIKALASESGLPTATFIKMILNDLVKKQIAGKGQQTMTKKYIAEREDGAIFVISQDEKEEAEHNSGSDWRSWEEYHGNLKIGAEVTRAEADTYLNKRYMVIDPCYLGEEELAKRYGSPISTFHTGDGVFEFYGQKVSVDSGIIHVYEVTANENLKLQGDLSENPFAEVAYLLSSPTQEEVDEAINNFDLADFEN
jgi:hypothetical protein